MSEMVSRFRKESSFLVFDGNTSVAKEYELVMKVYDVFLRGFWKHNDIINVDEHKMILDR